MGSWIRWPLGFLSPDFLWFCDESPSLGEAELNKSFHGQRWWGTSCSWNYASLLSISCSCFLAFQIILEPEDLQGSSAGSPFSESPFPGHLLFIWVLCLDVWLNRCWLAQRLQPGRVERRGPEGKASWCCCWPLLWVRLRPTCQDLVGPKIAFTYPKSENDLKITGTLE